MAVTPIFGLRPVTFRRRALQPPTTLYISSDERLNIRSVATLQNAVSYLRTRILALDGTIIEFEETLTPGTGVYAAEWNIQLPEGYLLSTCLSTFIPWLRRGVHWVRMQLRKGGPSELRPARVLIAGYLSSGDSLSWPEGPLQVPGEGYGNLHLGTYTPPAPGAAFIVTVPNNVLWRLAGVKLVLTTDANVANRRVDARIIVAGQEVWRAIANGFQVAGTTRHYIFSPAYSENNLVSSAFLMSLMPDCRLLQGSQFRAIVGSVQVGDQWTGGAVFIEEWILPY